MPECTVKLNSPTVALLAEEDQQTIITIPANALLTIIAGDIDTDRFVEVRYRNQVLSMFAQDLRSRGERFLKESA
jgi:hypothetical protein